MLKRISKIQGVGAFSNCTTSASAEFRKTTLVFGYNSHGKSTLAEIFRSIESNDAEELKSRLTIPNGKSQSAIFHLFSDGKGEVPHTFDGTSWKGGLDGAFSWRVFDSGFINRNVLSGGGMERANKENFSKFVLGEEGVKKAEDIASKKQESRRLGKEIKKIFEQIKVFAGNLTIEKFLALDISAGRERIKELYDAEVSAVGKIKEDRAAISTIKGRSVIAEVPRLQFMSKVLEELEVELAVSLNDVHDAARESLSEHVNNHMKQGHGQRDWIQKGVEFINNDTCPFCEQDFSENARGLISDYQAAFNDQFSAKLLSLKKRLGEIDDCIAQHSAPDFSALHLSNEKSCLLYPELLANEEFKQLLETFANLGGGLAAAAEFYPRLLETHGVNGRNAINKKKFSLFENFDLEIFTGLKSVEEMIDGLIVTYNELAVRINEVLTEFKAGISAEQFSVDEIAASGRALGWELILRRIDNSTLCEQYVQLSGDLQKNDAALTIAQEDLETEQSTYLGKFFEKINIFFGVFGSSDFTIAKVRDGRGDLPVYILGVQYKGKDIDSGKLGMVFSESDKRALALSIFWASLSVMEPASLASTIVVLDDPVTSFDDNRIGLAISQFRLMAMGLRQIICLSHYSNFVRRFLELEPIDGDFCLLGIDKSNVTSHILVGQPSVFLDSDHHKKFVNIMGFIEKRKADPIGSDLRVYLEEELRSRFRFDIAKLKIANSSLSELIDQLHQHGCYSSEVKDELHIYRQDLNSAHHQWESRTTEDWASFAGGMLNLIYTQL